ncbi:MAG: type II toxin-antitoxin system RelB/DinJ family antitoxin [Synergistaceae bacterium]|nr:type II toxin-antitoxin system RelB/DinJ family antitoxin [Synergistaceae bacterium]
MAKTTNVFIRVEPSVKEQAEIVLKQLGIPMSNAVEQFLRQVALQRGIPFEMKLPERKPPAYGALTKEQFDTEIEKGMADIAAGRLTSSTDVRAQMREAHGV